MEIPVADAVSIDVTPCIVCHLPIGLDIAAQPQSEYAWLYKSPAASSETSGVALPPNVSYCLLLSIDAWSCDFLDSKGTPVNYSSRNLHATYLQIDPMQPGYSSSHIQSNKQESLSESVIGDQ